MAICTSAFEDAEMDRILIQTFQKRDDESRADQNPKLMEARRLHAKAIQNGISRHTDLAVKKEESYYPVLGGFNYILITGNFELSKILQPCGLSVEMGCPYCVSSPNCVLEREFPLDSDVFIRKFGKKPRKLYDLFGEIMAGPRESHYKKMDCQRVSMDALNKWSVEELPQCVLGDIMDL